MNRRAPLKPRSRLGQRAPLARSSPLRSSKGIRSSSALHPKQRTAKKTEGGYFSIFTGSDVAHCYVTESAGTKLLPIDTHHIFPGPYKEASEEYGYVVPLRRDLHEGCHSGDQSGLWLTLKRSCEEEFLAHHGTADEFAALFGRDYLA